MCGIAGIFGGDAAGDVLRYQTSVMTRILAHRGPDSEGVWGEDYIALGHRRLSVLEPSAAGAQPMHSSCGRFVMVYNGEIYNHLELRATLEQSGAAPEWRGQSDTESLLAAIRAWGIDLALQRAAGMFALALWDREENRLSLARDRIGEKPLYWGFAGRSLVFASELKGITAHPDFPATTSLNALGQYLRYGYVPTPYCIYEGVYKLEPGTIFDIQGALPAVLPAAALRPGDRLGALSIRRYWSLVDVFANGAANPVRSGEEAVAELDQALNAAVRRQMLSDVPVGAFLSGGIDSSTITALMQRATGTPARTFTIGFQEAVYDESGHAEAVARHLKTDHTTVRVSVTEALQVIPTLPRMYDEPFADSSQIPTFLVCRAARQQVTVALTGDAGDELFGGYNRYLYGPSVWRRMSWLPTSLRYALGCMMNAVPRSVWDRLGTTYNTMRSPQGGVSALGDKVHRVADRLHRVRSPRELHRDLTSIWLEPPIEWDASERAPDRLELLDDPLQDHARDDPAALMMLQDIRTYLPDDLLCKVDRAAMAVSLETRVPFLDPEVISAAARIPSAMKIKDGIGKWPVRRILYEHVPQAIIDRPKAGFAIPVGEWVRGPLREWAEELLSADALRAGAAVHGGVLRTAPIRRVWEEHKTGKYDHTSKVWTILMLQAWSGAH